MCVHTRWCPMELGAETQMCVCVCMFIRVRWSAERHGAQWRAVVQQRNVDLHACVLLKCSLFCSRHLHFG